jgi:hypothetical protein
MTRTSVFIVVTGAALITAAGLYGLASLSADSARDFLLNAINKRLATPVTADAIDCKPSGISLHEGRRAFRCLAEMDCNDGPVEIVVFADLSKGPFLAGDPLSTRIFRACPEVLRRQFREIESQRIDQGG